MIKKIKYLSILISSICILAFSVTSSAAKDEEIVKLTLENAIKSGLQKSISLKQVENATAISALQNEITNYNRHEIDTGNNELFEGRKKINDAQNALNNNIAPDDITIAPGVVIHKGDNIDSYGLTPAQKAAVVSGVQTEINNQMNNILNGEKSLDSALLNAGATLTEKLGIQSTYSLDISSTGDLATTMSSIQYEVTKASYSIYKNQIALLIQKSYYDALKAKKMLEVKNKALERAQKQFEFSSDSYEGGMKAKDDMLLSKTYLRGTQIEYMKAEGELKASLVELKKNAGMPMDSQIELVDALAEKVEEQDVNAGLLNGMKNRLEIKKALGERMVYDLNLEVTKKKYPEHTFQYREADLNKEKAAINFEKVKEDVECSIRQSYEALKSTGEMLKTSKDMVGQAKESMEIAEYRYKEGYGTTDSALLKKLDIEATSGTIVEVLASEENLSQIEEKVVEITHGYNLAKMKYFNDIGKFIY